MNGRDRRAYRGVRVRIELQPADACYRQLERIGEALSHANACAKTAVASRTNAYEDGG
jgi:hypothetical protein